MLRIKLVKIKDNKSDILFSENDRSVNNMLCTKCNSTMRNTMHFERDKRYQYNECPKCYDRTKNKRIHFEDVLNEEKKLKNTLN